MKDSHPMGIGFVLVVGIVLFLILWFCCAKKHQDVVISFGKLSVLFAVLLMWMSLSIFPWDAIQNINEITAALVSSIQFPNRFLGWGTVFCVAVFGCCMWIFYEGRSQMAYYGMIILALLGITTSSMYLTDDACAKASYAKLYNEEGAGYGYIAGEEYLPEGVQAEKLLYNAPVTGKNVELRKYEKEYQTVDMECVNNGLRSSYIDIPILLYTGYRATDMETDQELEIVRGENGVVRVVLPAGYSGNIHVTFVSPIYWRISEVISAIFICIFIPLCIYSRRRMVVRKGEEAFVWSGLKKRKLW